MPRMRLIPTLPLDIRTVLLPAAQAVVVVKHAVLFRVLAVLWPYMARPRCCVTMVVRSGDEPILACLDPLLLIAPGRGAPVLDEGLRRERQPAEGPVSRAPRRALRPAHAVVMSAHMIVHLPQPFVEVLPEGHRLPLTGLQAIYLSHCIRVQGFVGHVA